MMALVPSSQVRTLTDAYKAEWAALGRAEADLPPLGISRQIVVADTNDKAQEIACGLRPVHRQPLLPVEEVRRRDAARRGLRQLRDRPLGPPLRRATRLARAWVAEHAETAGINYFSLEFAFGDMTFAETLRSAELFATEVMPPFA